MIDKGEIEEIKARVGTIIWSFICHIPELRLDFIPGNFLILKIYLIITFVETDIYNINAIMANEVSQKSWAKVENYRLYFSKRP